jgi:hypothetical protein
MSTAAQKTESEKALLKIAKRKHFEYRRTLNPGFVKGKGSLGLKSKDLTELSKLIRLANDIDANALS